MNPKPQFFDRRIKMFEELKAKHDAEVKGMVSSVVFLIQMVSEYGWCRAPKTANSYHYA